ncbi:aromatic hydrocarbon degradation protein [Leptospira perolatii]|uniref:Aromatic hydrocarbon degradation protein n=2 Tax=Leptospira perolatii TaxID=2023191 RepID=A0A2M9ZRN6_9LEPT|nr:aromatic hydrocarbon degradation protein [Leptospira perolatii]PJZ74704.1 aromatic hydrocarbon degradation protein [Leptospira perolatii]
MSRNALGGAPLKFKAVILCVLITCASTELFAGSYGDIYGAHPSAAGMGNAVTSIVNNSSAVFYNVAGLGRLSDADLFIANLEKLEKEKEAAADPTKEGNPADPAANGPILTPEPTKDSDLKWYKRIGYSLRDGFTKEVFTYKPLLRPTRVYHEVSFQAAYANPTLKNNAPQNDNIKNPDDSFAGLGLTLNLNEIFDIGRTIRFGINALVPASGNLLVVNDQNPTVPRYLQSGKSNERPTIMGGLGVELWKDRLFAGIGFTALAGGSGAILLKDVPISPDPVTANSQVILELKPLINPTYGLQFTYGKFSLGTSYKRETYLSADPIPARAQTTLLGIQLDFDLALLDQYNPRVWSYGLAFRPNQRWVLSVDMNRELWSGYQLSRIKKNYSEPLYLHDTTNVKFGTEFAILPMVKVRGGIGRRPSPVPHMPGENNWMDNDRNIYSVGASYIFNGRNFKFLKDRLRNPVIFDIAITNQQLRSVEVNKYIPTSRNPNYNYGGYIWSIAFSVSFFF